MDKCGDKVTDRLIDTFNRLSGIQDKKLVKEVADLIKINIFIGSHKYPTWAEDRQREIDQVAQEIDLLYNKRMEAQAGKTLALIASDADIPLWVAMACAKYGEQAALAKIGEVIPDIGTWEYGDDSIREAIQKGRNEVIEEIRQALGLKGE